MAECSICTAPQWVVYIVSFELGSFIKIHFSSHLSALCHCAVFLKHTWLLRVAIAKISKAQQEGIILLNRKNHMITLVYRPLDSCQIAQLLKLHSCN